MADTHDFAALFDDGKAPDAMRTIGEVSAAFDIKPHVLRYWEQQFPMLQPLKRSGGRRLYRTKDIALVGKIDQLVNQQGYTLKGAKKALQQGAGKAGEGEASSPDVGFRDEEKPAEMLGQLYSIRDRLANAVSS